MSTNTHFEQPAGIFALCDDGTLWARELKAIDGEKNINKWIKVKGVPQPERRKK